MPLRASCSDGANRPDAELKSDWQDRIHDSLEKDTPHRRPVEQKPSATATLISTPHLGGLHHRYNWREAA